MENELPSILTQFKLFLQNPVFLSAFISCFTAQIIKTAIDFFSGKIHSVKDFIETVVVGTGGMPSGHAATTTALCVSIGFNSGFHSNIFILSFMFFFVVIRDSFGVRHSSGLQAKKLNELGKELKDKNLISDFNKIKEVNGHTPIEVLCGIILGIVVAVSFSLLY